MRVATSISMSARKSAEIETFLDEHPEFKGMSELVELALNEYMKKYEERR